LITFLVTNIKHFFLSNCAGKARRKLPSPCVVHRCVNSPHGQKFECVDCLEIIDLTGKVCGNDDLDKVCSEYGVDIREICPEMLKVSPVGKRLAVQCKQNKFDIPFMLKI